jgi:hypothetical protein
LKEASPIKNKLLFPVLYLLRVEQVQSVVEDENKKDDCCSRHCGVRQRRSLLVEPLLKIKNAAIRRRSLGDIATQPELWRVA